MYYAVKSDGSWLRMLDQSLHGRAAGVSQFCVENCRTRASRLPQTHCRYKAVNGPSSRYTEQSTLSHPISSALQRFTDSVVLQVVERCYFSSDGPVMLITPEYIGEFSDQDMDEIAHETYETARARNDNGTRLQRLKQASAIAETESGEDVRSR
jgi:hypothetical protein